MISMKKAALGHGSGDEAEPRSESRTKLRRFMGLELEWAPGVLIPRPETELLARAALERLDQAARVADLCCGCGNLAAIIALAAPASRVVAADISAAATALARRNMARLRVSDRVVVREGDLFSALANDRRDGPFDMIVANPPYISSARLDSEASHLLLDEPREAFDGGPYGLSIHQRLISDAPAFLTPGGRLLFEFGAGQERQVELLFARARSFEDIVFLPDEGGRPRVAAATLRGRLVTR